ncbi:MAG: hydrogenase expression/formation protein [Methylococcaceae bacterium]|nr:hydrogenase expression/formation protein [Methylococcaceae bacterium]
MLDQHALIAVETAPPVSPFDDPECQYLAMPQSMRTFAAPSAQDWGRIPGARELLTRLADGLSSSCHGMGPTLIDLAPFDEDIRHFMDQLLGEGEISVLADAPSQRLNIVEAVYTGVWRVRLFQNGAPVQDILETGPFPRILADWLASHECPPSLPDSFPENLMNAPALVHELFDKTARFVPGREEVINLSLLPLTAEDIGFLVECLGLAGISILSKGYGECRITRTRLPNLWWVQYFNSTDQLILSTFEITALPEVVMAAAEDLEDSASRLKEVLAELERS